MKLSHFLPVFLRRITFLLVMLYGIAPPAWAEGKLLRLHVGTYDPVKQAAPAALTFPKTPVETDTWIVQLQGSASSTKKTEMAKSGVEVLRYLPDDAYLVRGARQDVQALRSNFDIRWIGPFEPAHRLAPPLLALQAAHSLDSTVRKLEAKLWPGENPSSVIDALEDAGATSIRLRQGESDNQRILFEIASTSIKQVAQIQSFEWIEDAPQLTRRNNTTRWVVQSNAEDFTPLWDRGLTGEGELIGHIDADIDYVQSCYFTDSEVSNPGSDHRKIQAHVGGFHPSDTSNHGTHTAGVAAGKRENGDLFGAGMAPDARLYHAYDFDVEGQGDTASNLESFFLDAYAAGVRIHTNSWGDDGQTGYTFWCRDIDKYTDEQEDSLVVFSVSNGSLLRTPENAKNCLAVAASRQAPAQHNFHIGGRGPTYDGRRKPEICAPGSGIISALRDRPCSLESASGTSFSSPAVAGIAALVRQYYREGYYPGGTFRPWEGFTPSGALLKATLLNAAVDMTGVDGYPGNQEGWGRLDADESLWFDGGTRVLNLFDVRNADGLSSGTAFERTFDVLSPGEELRVTLVWTDPPATHQAAKALINDLDLQVITPGGGDIYAGNVFANGYSVPNIGRDSVNNVEVVLIAAPEIGEWTVRVAGTAIPDGPQGFAVVMNGALAPGTPAHSSTVQSSWSIY